MTANQKKENAMSNVDKFNSAISMLRDEYFDHVESLAADFVAEIGDEYRSREALYDGIMERCDSDEWVIYTARAQAVVMVSDSVGDAISEFGADSIVSGGDINWSFIACVALVRDVQNALPALADDDEIFDIAAAMHDAGIRPGDGETLAEMAFAWQEDYDGGSDAEDWFTAKVSDPETANALDAVGVDPFDADHAPIIAAVVAGTMTADDAGAAVAAMGDE